MPKVEPRHVAGKWVLWLKGCSKGVSPNRQNLQHRVDLLRRTHNKQPNLINPYSDGNCDQLLIDYQR